MQLDAGAGPIEGTTRVVGIIGSPVSHSLSPRMHNAAFASLGLDFVYVPCPVEASSVGEAVRGIAALGLVGANVTIPHKSAVLEHCDVVEPSAGRCGSVNTLIVTAEGIVGASTDGEGVAGGLDSVGAHCLVLGAGGASRPVIVALAEAGARRITIAARRAEAARELALDLADVCENCEITSGTWPPAAEGDIVVNATPIKDDPMVELSPTQQVVDLAYLPSGQPTALVGAAQAAGCERIIDGLEFLVRQGATSFERWTGQAAPFDVMRRAVRPALGG